MKVAILDYGLGNIFSVKQACAHARIDAILTSNPDDVKLSDGIILPGVGAFGDAMNYLKSFGLIEPIKEFINTGKPFMGICLGMQLMFSESEEFGAHEGLELIPGKIKRFPYRDKENNKVSVPQIQWNQIQKNNDAIWQGSALKGIPENTYVQFVHSYYAAPETTDHVLAYTEYADIRYTSAVKRDNMTGFQFHPEKSGELGLRMYENWAKG
jgi:glutamine amidotransferase